MKDPTKMRLQLKTYWWHPKDKKANPKLGDQYRLKGGVRGTLMILGLLWRSPKTSRSGARKISKVKKPHNLLSYFRFCFSRNYNLG